MTSTTQHSLKSLEQQSQKEKDSATDCGLQNQELHSLLLTSSANISACLQERYCNGIAGVPITFLDKYSPEQFRIIWQASGNTKACCPENVLSSVNYRQHEEDRGGCGVVHGKRVYSRILVQKII